MPTKNKIYFIERSTGAKEEEQIYFESALRFFYGSFLGKWVNAPLARFPIFSRFFGWWQRRSTTKKKIAPFITKYRVDPTEFEKKIDEFTSFDDFFTRKLKKEQRPLSQGIIIPADGRYLFYQNIDQCDGFVVKGKKFTLEKLLCSEKQAHQYRTGSMVIARLAPCDYHRFHFPTACLPSPAHLINGLLFSVNPLAVQQNVALLTENKRMITHLKSQKYGNILFIEIGATMVGSIHQTYTPHQPYNKGDEKGYFSFGGSSIILLFEPGRIQFAPDLLAHSSNHIETLCRFGQSLEINL